MVFETVVPVLLYMRNATLLVALCSFLLSADYSSHLFAVGWASDNARGFGEQPGVKAQVLNIIHSTRTVMRSKNSFNSTYRSYTYKVVLVFYFFWRQIIFCAILLLLSFEYLGLRPFNP